MAIGGIGQENVLRTLTRNTQDTVAAQQRTAATAAEGKTTAATNADKVDFSRPVVQAASAGAASGETPQQFASFSEEIESAIGRIENIIKESKNVPATGSMIAHQQAEIVNNPGKGVVENNKERVAEERQRADAQRAQETAAQSIASPSQGSLSAIIDRIGDEQANRGQQTQSAAAAQLAY